MVTRLYKNMPLKPGFVHSHKHKPFREGRDSQKIIQSQCFFQLRMPCIQLGSRHDENPAKFLDFLHLETL